MAKKIECPRLFPAYLPGVCGDDMVKERAGLESLVDGMQSNVPEVRLADGLYLSGETIFVPPYDGFGSCGMI